MGGICGILRFDGEPADQRVLDRQLRALAHLGPDGAHGLCDGAVGLGWLSLQVTHEDGLDALPLADHDSGVLLVADLRLDNRDELAASLGIDAAALERLPDSELLLSAYLRWGEACAAHLLGDFAFAIWDPRQRSLLLGRDHMGQRHLFFHAGDRFLAFATEIKGLWAVPEAPRALHDPYVATILMRRWDKALPGRTKFEAIECLPGGTVLAVRADGARSQSRYWAPQAAPEHLGHDEPYYRRAYRDVLGEAVACRLRRAVRPAGLLLSGGFDSVAIAALAAPALDGGKLITVTSALTEAAPAGPLSARYWVELCRSRMSHLDIRYATREGRSVFSDLDRRLLAGDGQVSVNAYVNDELYAQAAAAGARVVMDGHGGDYTLNPKPSFPATRYLLLGRFREFLTEFRAQRRQSRTPLLRSLWRQVFAPFTPRPVQRLRRLARSGAALGWPLDPVSPDLARLAKSLPTLSADETDLATIRHPRTAIARVLSRQQESPSLGGLLPAAHGLSFTQPFHDKRVVELALAIPEDLYARDGLDRHLVRLALADLLPPEFQTRSSQNIPLVPDLARMAGEQTPRMLAEIDRLERNGRVARYFDFPRMRRMLAHRGAGGYESQRLRHAMRGLMWALHIEWFLRDND